MYVQSCLGYKKASSPVNGLLPVGIVSTKDEGRYKTTCDRRGRLQGETVEQSVPAILR